MYTEEETTELVEAYLLATNREEQEAVVAKYVEKFNKPKASIIMKLSKAGIYQPKQRVSSITGLRPKTKEDMVTELEEKLKVAPGFFRNLDKVPKTTLYNIMEKFDELIKQKSTK